MHVARWNCDYKWWPCCCFVTFESCICNIKCIQNHIRTVNSDLCEHVCASCWFCTHCVFNSWRLFVLGVSVQSTSNIHWCVVILSRCVNVLDITIERSSKQTKRQSNGNKSHKALLSGSDWFAWPRSENKSRYARRVPADATRLFYNQIDIGQAKFPYNTV